LGAVGEAHLAHAPTAQNELNCAKFGNNMPNLKKSLRDTFYPNNKGLSKLKTHLTLLSH
jgi:hypothetical protein